MLDGIFTKIPYISFITNYGIFFIIKHESYPIKNCILIYIIAIKFTPIINVNKNTNKKSFAITIFFMEIFFHHKKLPLSMFAGKKKINGIELYIEYNNLKKVKDRQNPLDKKEIPYIIMHGHSANHFFMKPIFDKFNAQGLPVLMFDLRGHGWSQKNLKGGYSLENCVEDLYGIYSELIQKEFGYEKFYLSGHSMGGFIAMMYALKYPHTLEKLALLSTSPNLADGWIRRLGAKIVLNGFKTNYDKWFNMKKKDHIRIGIEKFPQWIDHSLMPEPQAVIEFLERIIDYNIERRLPEIKTPTFVCMSKYDGTMTMKMFNTLTNKIPNTHSYLYKKYKHNITLEAEDLPEHLMRFFYQ